jgi:hypothetical protein
MFRFPDDTERHFITGTTGSGKTVFGLWCLSRRTWDEKPWIIVDFKGDGMIAQIPRIEEFSLGKKIPTKPGIYVVRPLPGDVDEGLVTQLFFDIWAKEHTGLFVDECYMLKQHDKGLRAILTQGRSKHIPAIILSQRPSWITPFAMSESEYKSVFTLQTPADNDRIREWLPQRMTGGARVDPLELPYHHSYWYCMKTRDFAKFGPCPDEQSVLNDFDRQKPRRSWY